MIFRAGPIDMLEIDANAEGFVLLGDHDNISEPLGVVYIADERSCQKPSHLLANCLSLLRDGPAEMLFNGFCFRVDSQTVLSQSPGYT